MVKQKTERFENIGFGELDSANVIQMNKVEIIVTQDIENFLFLTAPGSFIPSRQYFDNDASNTVSDNYTILEMIQSSIKALAKNWLQETLYKDGLTLNK